MAFFDKLKEATGNLAAATANAAQKAKESYEAGVQKRQEEKAAAEAHAAEMRQIAEERAREIENAILEYGKNNTDGFFSKNTVDEIFKYTKDFFDKILLPANSITKSYVSMHPHIDKKALKNINKFFPNLNEAERLLMHVKDNTKQEFFLSYDNFYFKMLLPEDTNFFIVGQVPCSAISLFSLVKEDDHYSFLCDEYKLSELKIIEGHEEDFITLNRYFSDIKNQDFTITDEEIDRIIQEKIGSKIYEEIKKYMTYDDELAIYFAWGLDSWTAKDYIVCTTKQIILMNREAFGAMANVKQYYYEDITSAATVQGSGDTSLTGMLLDAAFASLFQQCDLVLTVAGSSAKLSNLYKIEAERVVEVYHQYRKLIKTAQTQPQQVVVQQQNSPDILEQLEKLAKLKDAGILSEEEFSQKKASLLEKL